ncbi:helix-turn-helix domain-containing protein [Streptomyces sp. NPDC087440]|uniref:helix-turn-helix domain-containing protein n=1 Tax=Streptomyces sp. NPDC087440 TaxID=3365790 RepID=UPI00382D09EC
MRTNPALGVPDDLWDQPSVERALAECNMQILIRHFRRFTGASQTTVGALTGLAQSDVSEIERGKRLVQSKEVIERIAAGLSIPFSLLGLATPASAISDAGPSRPTVGKGPGGRGDLEDDVRRRDMMTGSVGVSIALLTGTSPHAVAAEPTADPTAELERGLFDAAPGRPAKLTELHAGLAKARDAFSDVRYADLGRGLPSLISAAEATRDASTGHRRERAQVAVARAYVLATELAVKQHSELAIATADRALTAARASGSPQALSEAARVLAITMRRAGRSPAAVDFLARTATSLGADTSRSTPEALAAKTCLLLTAAYTAASGQRRSTALDLLAEAEESAARLPAEGPDVGLFTIAASPAECAMYRISTYQALGTPDDGVPYIARIDPKQLSNVERVARYLTDSARTWRQLGDGQKAFNALRAIEQIAPEEVRRPAVRTLTADLLYMPHRISELRPFAVRTGAVPA